MMQVYDTDYSKDTCNKLHKQKFKTVGNQKAQNNYCDNMDKQGQPGIIKCTHYDRNKTDWNSHDIRNIHIHDKCGKGDHDGNQQKQEDYVTVFAVYIMPERIHKKTENEKCH